MFPTSVKAEAMNAWNDEKDLRDYYQEYKYNALIPSCDLGDTYMVHLPQVRVLRKSSPRETKGPATVILPERSQARI